FQGTYDDLLSKLNTALASNAAPALVQVYDIGQRYMYDSGQVVPMQAFIDRDKFSTADFEPAVINYYKYQDKLQSMPFNASSSIFYYNKDAFTEVGLDPAKPPVTFSEITDAAKKLTKKDASGNTVRYGFGPSIYGWFFEQLLATSGALYADHGNGRDDRATKVVYNNAAGKAILDWWKAGIDGGYFYNPGIDNAGATTAFQSGKTAMYLESSAALRGNINTAKFQVGTGLFARPDNKPANGGNIIGGASLYIMKSRPAEEQQAAWEFVKYAMTPAVQAQWQSDTGYYAVVKTAYNEAPAKEWATKYPQFQTPVDQSRNSPQNRMTNTAALCGSGPPSRPTRLIHGGLRYLEIFDFALVRSDMREREILLRIASHLVFPLPFLLPLYRPTFLYQLKLRLGMQLYDLLSLDKSLPKRQHLDRSATLAAEPSLEPDGLAGAWRFYDAQVPLVERLVVENLVDASAHGASVLNHARVIEFLREDDRVVGARVRD